MPQPRFQVSTVDSFGAPGVYIQKKPVSAPLRGIFRGTTGFVGTTVRGPVNKIVFCATYQRFLDVFGGRDYGVNGGVRVSEIWWALQNKQFGRFYAVRAAAAAAATASFEFNSAAAHAGANIINVAARNPGAWGNSVKTSVQAASDGNANHFNLAVKLWDRTWLFPNVDTFGTDDNTAIVVGADDATPIVVTKLAAGRPVNNTPNTDGADANGYVALGQVQSGYVSVPGADGSIADADFTVGGGPMEILHAARGIDSKLVAGRSNTNIKTKIFALSPTANLSGWLISPDNETVTDTTWETELAGYRNSAIFPCFNHPYYIDPVTTVETVGEPHVQMASILSQINYDVHPGVADTAPLNQSITRLAFELMDGQRDALDAAGTSYLNRDVDQDGNDVFLFGNGRTADLSVNNSQVDGERMKMFLIMGLSTRSRGDEKRPNTKTARSKRKGAFTAWLTALAKAEAYVDSDDSGVPQFEIKNDTEVNTATDRAAGIQRDLVRIKLIPKNLYLQLQVEAGTDVVISTVGDTAVPQGN